jgi:hypothetical protein
MAELYRRIVEVLQSNNCRIVHAGKGHEIWFSPVNGKHVSVPRSTKSRHTANDVLKKAGLPKAF